MAGVAGEAEPVWRIPRPDSDGDSDGQATGELYDLVLTSFVKTKKALD